MEIQYPIPENSHDSDREFWPKRGNNSLERIDRAALEHAMWSVFVLISRKLQISSATIKAGVSSLLDNSIFWDGSTQHEFLESINSSTNQTSKLIMLVSLVSLIQAENLVVKPEPQMLQEIISVAYDQFKKTNSDLPLEITLSSTGRTVLVDYEYLVLALKLILEIISETGIDSNGFSLVAYDCGQQWNLDIVGDTPAMAPFNLIEQERIVELLTSNSMSPENRLKCYLIFQIFVKLDITTEVFENTDTRSGLRIIVPCTGMK